MVFRSKGFICISVFNFLAEWLAKKYQSFSERRRSIERRSEREIIVSERERERRSETDRWALSASAP